MRTIMFHNIIHSIKKGNKLLTIDQKSDNMWIFRVTTTDGDRDFIRMTCTVTDHPDLPPFDCYIENTWIDNSHKGFFWKLLHFLFRRTYEEVTVQELKPLFLYLEFHRAYFKRSLDNSSKVIKLPSFTNKVSGGGMSDTSIKQDVK